MVLTAMAAAWDGAAMMLVVAGGVISLCVLGGLTYTLGWAQGYFARGKHAATLTQERWRSVYDPQGSHDDDNDPTIPIRVPWARSQEPRS